MADNPEEWRRLRSEFIEAAAKYEEYETFIERTAHGEDRYYNNGRYFPVGLIRWPYKPYRKCWILASDSGEDAEPFSAMKTLFSKAWLWLPRDIADEVVDTAETHLSEPPSPPADTALFWANSHYQYWCWLLWFYWLRQRREANPTEAERPSQKMVLAPFHCSADLIAQWGLDGSVGTIPEWLSLPTAPAREVVPKLAATQSLLTVESWSELAIGVGEDGYWALGHVPDVGSVFPKESAVELDLPGDRWKNVLKLLANSPDGQSALKRDLFIELGYLSSAVKDEDIDDLRHDDGAMTNIKSASNRLTQAMGDLSRELRGLVSAKDTKKRVAQISTSGDDHVRSLFTCRHFVRGADGKLRFGSGE